MHNARRLLAYLRPYRIVFLFSLATAACASALDGLSLALFVPFFRVLFASDPMLPELATPVEHVTGRLIGSLSFLTTSVGSVYTVVVLIAVALLLKNVMTYVSTYASRVIEEGVTRDVRAATYSHLLRLDLAVLRRKHTGDVTSRLFSDIDQLRSFISAGLQALVRSGILALVYVAILLGLDWRMALATVVLASAVAFGIRPIVSRIRKHFQSAFAQRGRSSALVTATLGAAHVVKAHGAESFESARFEKHVDGSAHDRLRAERYALLASPLGETLGVGMFLLLLAGGASIGSGGVMRPEVFVGFAAVTLRLLSPLKRLAGLPAVVQQADAAAERVFELLDNENLDVDADRLKPFTGFDDAISFNQVWFAYEPGRWVLRGVDLRIARGDVVALVGVSGAGKSTLLDLLPRFIDPDRGSVTFDGTATTEFSRESLRRQMAIVSQDAVLFNDTIHANIAYGERADAPIEAVQWVAKLANAHEFIERLPLGYDTVVGERGALLSGGERQRIAIARAFLRDAPILILDEATSALDRESERLVQDAMLHLMENRTVLVIAHRQETVASAHRVAVLDEGKVAEVGRPADLMTGGGAYRQIRGSVFASSSPQRGSGQSV